MNKIPTAEEFLDNNRCFDEANNTHLKEVMIKFAKLHVKAALEAVKTNINVDIDEFGNVKGYDDEMYQSILNSYPLLNIK